MNLNHLYYFSEIIKNNSISNASKNLYMSPSALIAAVNSLEKELDCKLLERSKKGTVPTAAGAIVYEDTLEIFETFEKWKRLKYGLPSKQEKMNIYCVPTINTTLMPKIAVEIFKEVPNIEFSYEVIDSSKLENYISLSEIAFGIISINKKNLLYFSNMIKNLNFDMTLLLKSKYELFVASNNSQFPSYDSLYVNELANLPLISFSSPTFFKSDIAKYINNLLSDSFSLDALIELVIDGDYCTLLPSLFRESNYCKCGKLRAIPIVDCNFELDYYFITQKKTSLSPDKLKAVNLIINYFDEMCTNHCFKPFSE